MFGCKTDQADLFSQSPAIYFGNPQKSTTLVPVMSTNYSFAKFIKRTSDTLKIPVSIWGLASTTDRTFVVEKYDTAAANGVEGQDFKILGPQVILANSYSSVVKVVVYRTSKLDNMSANFFLRIKPNENFQVAIATQKTYQIKVNFLQMPDTWLMVSGSQGWASSKTNFGTWTKSKYQVILDALYSPKGDSTITEFPYSIYVPPTVYAQYLLVVKNYLKVKYPGNYSTPIGVGVTLTDPDASNLPIQVGPANY